MEKSTKKQLSLICFLIGFILVLLQDLKGFATIDPGFSWPWAVMFYSGLLLMMIGYYLRG
jgi:drug/metabolite transporter (DMT)-like permease